MRHLFGRRHADETLFDADAQLLERSFSLLMNLLRLRQLLLPGLVKILQKLLALIELLRNLWLGDLFDCAVRLCDADDLLLQRRAFRVHLFLRDRSATDAAAAAELAAEHSQFLLEFSDHPGIGVFV